MADTSITGINGSDPLRMPGMSGPARTELSHIPNPRPQPASQDPLNTPIADGSFDRLLASSSLPADLRPRTTAPRISNPEQRFAIADLSYQDTKDNLTARGQNIPLTESEGRALAYGVLFPSHIPEELRQDWIAANQKLPTGEHKFDEITGMPLQDSSLRATLERSIRQSAKQYLDSVA